MKLVRNFLVTQVNALNTVCRAFELDLCCVPNTVDKRSTMIINETTCRKYSLSMSNLANIVCSLETYEPKLQPLRIGGKSTDALISEGGMAVFADRLAKNDLPIRLVMKNDLIAPRFGAIPSDTKAEVSCMLKLSTYSFVAAHHRQRPVPFYDLFVELSEDEYKQVLELPPTTIFRSASVSLA